MGSHGFHFCPPSSLDTLLFIWILLPNELSLLIKLEWGDWMSPFYTNGKSVHSLNTNLGCAYHVSGIRLVAMKATMTPTQSRMLKTKLLTREAETVSLTELTKAFRLMIV